MNNVLKEEQGFTILQVLVSIGLAGILSLAVMRQQELINKVKVSSRVDHEIQMYQFNLKKHFERSCEKILKDYTAAITKNISTKLEDFYVKDEDGNIQKNDNNKALTQIRSLTNLDILEYDPTINGNKVLYTLMNQNMSIFPYNEAKGLSPSQLQQLKTKSKALIQNIRIVQNSKTRLSIYYDIIRGKRSIASKLKQNFFGYQSRQFQIPLTFYYEKNDISDINKFRCSYDHTRSSRPGENGLDGTDGVDGPENPFNTGKDLACEEGEVFKGIFANGEPDCDPIEAKEKELEFGNLWQKSLYVTDTKKNKTMKCNKKSPLVGVQYDVKGIFGGKENVNVTCVRKLQTTIGGKLFEQAGLHEDRVFESKAQRYGWAHCPEGLVMSEFKFQGDKEVDYKCHPMKFESEEVTQTCSTIQRELLQDRISSHNMEIAELKAKINAEFHINGRQTQKSTRLRATQNRLNDELVQDKIKLSQCDQKKTVITSREIAAVTVSGKEGRRLNCPKGKFLTGIKSTGKNDTYKIRCSALSPKQI